MEFKIETKGIDGIIKSLDPKLVKRATVHALNRTAASAKTAVKRMLRQTYTLKAGIIHKALKIKKANYANPQAEIGSDFMGAAGGRKEAAHGALPLFKLFTVRPTEISVKAKIPVAVKIRKDKPWRILRGAPHLTGKPFVAEMKSGHRGIFQRIPGTRMADKNKEKIQEIYSFFLPKVLLSKQVTEQVTETIQRTIDEQFMKRFNEAYKFYQRR